jgi:hypothetical protein
MAHGHVHVPHEITEKHEHEPAEGAPDRPERGERLFELGAILLLSLTTLATAWSGYQAARWSGEQSQHYARASATRIKAQQQSTAAGQLRIDDLLFFNGWLDASSAGDAKLAAVYRRRFRPEFVPAFRAWMTQRDAPGAVPGPTYMREYRLAENARSAVLDAQADELYREGTQAKTNDDRYILSTLFFAAVLFFAGISLRLLWRPLRLAVLGAATALLLAGVVYVGTLPIA